MNPAMPDPAGLPGHKAVGITLAPGPGRVAALVITAVPVLIIVIYAVVTASSGGSPYGGGNPYGLPAQTPVQATTSAAAYPSAETTSSATYPATLAPTSPAATAPSSPATTVSQSPAATSGPAATVQMAYNAINVGDYRKAYSLGLGPGMSYADFVAGYQDTNAVAVTIVSVQGDVVTVDLTSAQNDGTDQTFTGTYTVSGGRITNANIQQTS